MMKSFRTKRSNHQQDEKLGDIRLEDSTNETDSDQSMNRSENNSAENCLIQCIFEKMQMTDMSGYPVHAKIIEQLLKNATNRELRDFLQDTTDECFQEMDKESTMDPCTYSMRLATCLSDKGKTNCSDWPVGDLPFQQ